MSIVFGNLTQSFINFGAAVQNFNSGSGDSTTVAEAAARFKHDASTDAAILVYIGIGMFAAVYTYMCTWVYTGEVASKRVRETYLKAVMRQDIAFFDNVGAGEITTRIQTDTRAYSQSLNQSRD